MSELSPKKVLTKIYSFRGMKVMMDRDLAELYGIQTKRLKEQVRRNRERFPEDFMFELSKEEFQNWRSQFATSNKEKMGLRILPYVFTEHGVLMLSSVLKSKQAIKVNIQIMRIFTKMRKMLFEQKDMILQMQSMEHRLQGHDGQIKIIFDYLKKFSLKKNAPRKRIGFKK